MLPAGAKSRGVQGLRRGLGAGMALGVILAAAVSIRPAAAADYAPQINAAELGLAAPPPAPRPTDIEPALTAYFDACVAQRGQWQAVVDWGLSNGFDPLDPAAMGQEDFLDGRNGTALVRLAPGRIILAVTDDGHCTVWIEHASGPKVQMAFLQASSRLTGDRAKAKRSADRTVSRAGTWRRLVQWRYDVQGEEGGTYRVALVTMLNEGLGTQALSFAPWPAETAPASTP